MKILSKKKYNKILDDCKELQKTVEELKRKYESVKEILETEKNKSPSERREKVLFKL